MSAETRGPGGESLGAQVEEAERRLQEAAAGRRGGRERAAAEIRALEADLERERAARAAPSEPESCAFAPRRGARARARGEGAGDRRRRERLGEIEAQAEAAEKRVEEAERRAADAERAVADDEARAREGAAAWLREQLDAIRREAERR